MGNKAAGGGSRRDRGELLLSPGAECLVRWQQKWRLGIVRSIDRNMNVMVDIRVRHKNMLIEVLSKDLRRRLARRGAFPVDEEADPTAPLPHVIAQQQGSSRSLAAQEKRRSVRPPSAPMAFEVDPIPDGFTPVTQMEMVDVLDKSNPLKVQEPKMAPLPLLSSARVTEPPRNGWRWRPAVVEAARDTDGALFVRFADLDDPDTGPDLVRAGYPRSAVLMTADQEDCLAEYETKTPAQIAHHPWAVGDVLDVLDVFVPKRGKGTRKKWRKCQIVRTHGQDWIRVTFVGWSRAFDDWLHAIEQEDRLAEFGSQTEKDLARKEGLDAIFTDNLRRDKRLTVFQVDPDGNCLFNAIAHQVYGDVERHDIVRSDVCDYLEKNRERFEVLLESGQFDQYVAHKRKLKVWGDDPEVRAAEELYDRPVEIYVAQGMGDNTDPLKLHFEGDLPPGDALRDCAPIRLSFHGKNHYNSVIPYVSRKGVDEDGQEIEEDVSADAWKPPPLRQEGVIRRHRRAQAKGRRDSALGFAVTSNELDDDGDDGEDDDEGKAQG